MNRALVRAAVLLAAIALGPAVSAGQAASPAAARATWLAADSARIGRALDAWAQPLVAARQLSGNLLIAKGRSIVLERSWGAANFELGAPIRADTRFCIASITKPMTVLMAVQLMEERKLGYTDSIARWFPGFPRGDRITVEHLLRHRSGIPHRVTTAADEAVPHTAADMVEFAARASLEFAPGDSNQYSSGGFGVLARVLELAGGASYDRLLQERICKPAGLASTLHAGAADLVPNRATPYVPGLGGLRNPPLQDLSFLVGAGSVMSTAGDLHLLIMAVLEGRYGEGSRLSILRGTRIGWNGSTNGFRAFADHDTTTGWSVVFTGNLHCGAVDQMRAAVHALLRGETPEPASLPPARAAVVAESTLRGYEGLYRVAGNPRLEVRARDGGLDAGAWTLVPLSDSTFFSLRDYATVTAVPAEGGGIARLDWKIGKDSYPCPRVGDLPKP